MPPSSLRSQAGARIRAWPGVRLGLRLLLVVASPLVFFGGLEGGLRLAGYGKPSALFIPGEKPGYFRTNPHFTDPFIPASFGLEPLNFRLDQHKAPGSVRVFVLGESAAQGMPAHDLGFAAQLRAQLGAQFPGKTFEVINLGITAIDSHVVHQIARQAVAFEPDLFVVYMGNNEMVGPYGPGCFYLSATMPIQLIRASVWVRGTRTGQLLAALLGKRAPAGAEPMTWKGMASFSGHSVRADDPALETAYRNFSVNLRDIVDLGARAGIKTVLATVAANLKDSAPFVSLHRVGLSPAEMKSWQAATDAGLIAWNLGDAGVAARHFSEARRIDPEFAETHFRLGRLAEALGETARARGHYLDALHWDALRFRPDVRINEIIRETAREAGDSVILVDSAKLLGADPGADAPPAGREILFDHVHFNWPGNYQMARLLAGAAARGLFGPARPPGAELDAAGCAAALGYTDEAELQMLSVIVQLMLRPPFTNQFTFSVDQAWFQQATESASARLAAPGVRAANLEAVVQAHRRDPANPALLLRLGTMEAGAGNFDRALAWFDQAGVLLPRSAEFAMLKAPVLVRLRKFAEAEALLLAAMETDAGKLPAVLRHFGPGGNRAVLIAGGALFDLWAESGQFEKGKIFFTGALAAVPANQPLRLEYANFLVRQGDWAAAESEARRILQEAPGSRSAVTALELLVQLCAQQGRTAEVETLSLKAHPHQADNFNNLQRLVEIYSARNDFPKVIECLQALAALRPFDATQHLDLARRLAEMNRGEAMLHELAQAREIARVEGDAHQIRMVAELIDIYRPHFAEGKRP